MHGPLPQSALLTVTLDSSAKLSLTGGGSAVMFSFEDRLVVGPEAAVDIYSRLQCSGLEGPSTAGHTFAVGGTIDRCEFPGGLRMPQSSVTIEAPQRSVCVAMGTTWYGLDRTTNQGM